MEILQNIKGKLFVLLVSGKQSLCVVVALIYGSSSRAAEIVEYPRHHSLYVWNLADIFYLPFVNISLAVLSTLVGYRSPEIRVSVSTELRYYEIFFCGRQR